MSMNTFDDDVTTVPAATANGNGSSAPKGVKLPKDFLIPFTLVTPANVDGFVAIADRVYK